MANAGVVRGQGALDFERAAFQGNTVKSRHASWTGAVKTLETRTWKRQAYEQLIRNHGPMTDNEAATVLGWPLSSVCSTRNGILELAKKRGEPAPFEPVDFETVAWGDGKSTKRARWGVRT